MHKRIIIPVFILLTILFTSCSSPFTVTTESAAAPKKNTNKSNSIKVDKSKTKDQVKLSPYYEQLELGYGFKTLESEAQRNLYFEILNNCSAITDEIDTDAGRKSYYMEPFTIYDCSVSDVDIYHVRSAVMLDNPQIFWLDSYYTYSLSDNDFTLTLQSTMSRKTYEKRLKQLNAVVSDILAGLNDNMSDYDRELYLHDYIVKNCKYVKNADDSVDDDPYTVYGCLVEQKAVCEGYTKALQYLLACCGVPSVTIKGSVQESDTVDHIWNAVKIDGDWYNTDVTWDDTDEISMYDCFNQTDEVFNKTHSVSPLLDTVSEDNLRDDEGYFIAFNILVPECNSIKHNYFVQEGTELKNLDNNTIAKDLTDAVTLGKPYYYIYVNPKYLDYENVYYQLFSQDYYGFADYLREANSNMGYDAVSLSTTVIKKTASSTIAVELRYN